MSRITKYALSDLYEMSSGISSTKEQAGHGAPFVSFSTVFNNYFLPDELFDLMDTNEKEQEIYSIKSNKVINTMYLMIALSLPVVGYQELQEYYAIQVVI